MEQFIRPCADALFVRELGDGTLIYDVVIVDKERKVKEILRVALFDGEPVSCENHATREHTHKTRAIVPERKMVTLHANPLAESIRNN